MKQNLWSLMGTIMILGAIVWFNPTIGNQLSAAISRHALPAAAKKATPTPTPTQAGGDQTYSRLVQQYQNARIQFNDACQAMPSSTSVQKGTYLMLDNRSSTRHTIQLGAKTYPVPAYGYHLVPVPASGPVTIHCDRSVNVGTLNVQ